MMMCYKLLQVQATGMQFLIEADPKKHLRDQRSVRTWHFFTIIGVAAVASRSSDFSLVAVKDNNHGRRAREEGEEDPDDAATA